MTILFAAVFAFLALLAPTPAEAPPARPDVVPGVAPDGAPSSIEDLLGTWVATFDDEPEATASFTIELSPATGELVLRAEDEGPVAIRASATGSVVAFAANANDSAVDGGGETAQLAGRLESGVLRGTLFTPTRARLLSWTAERSARS